MPLGPCSLAKRNEMRLGYCHHQLSSTKGAESHRTLKLLFKIMARASQSGPSSVSFLTTLCHPLYTCSFPNMLGLVTDSLSLEHCSLSFSSGKMLFLPVVCGFAVTSEKAASLQADYSSVPCHSHAPLFGMWFLLNSH